jgi:AcrR family transcriptional regulator
MLRPAMSRVVNRTGPDTRRRIIAAARACFGRSGYDLTTNKDIATEAEVTTGAIYHHFDSKPDLFVAVHDELTAHLADAFERAAAGASTLPSQLRAILDLAVETNRSDPSIGSFSVIAHTELHRHPELAAMVADRTRIASLFARLVRSAHQRGELTDDVDTNATASMLVAVSMGLAQLGALVEDADAQKAAVDAFLRSFEGSMFAAPLAISRRR